MVSTTGGPVWLTGIPHLVCILYTAGGCCTVSQEIVCKLEGVVVTWRGHQPRLGTEPTTARIANSKQVSALPTPNKGLHCQLHQDLRYQLQTRICAANSKQGSALPTPPGSPLQTPNKDLRCQLQTGVCTDDSKQGSALPTPEVWALQTQHVARYSQPHQSLRCQLRNARRCQLPARLCAANATGDVQC